MFNSLFKKNEPKVFVFGIDGVPYSLLKKYIDEGYLPNFKHILNQGYSLNQMDASIPDVSSTSWTSFMTGVNPGEHGIYGFIDLKPQSYNMFFPNFNNINAPAFWEILGKTSTNKTSTLSEKYVNRLNKEYRSIVINVPQTYPANPINGILTAGFVALDLKKATYPDSAYQYLASIDYMIDVDSMKAKHHKDEFIEELFETLDKRTKAIKYFLKNESWGLFVGTVTETDRLHHFFFDAAYDPNHKYHESFISFYGKLDEAIGEVFDKFMDLTKDKGLFLTMSDHGFTELKQEVYINNWLREQGFLNIDNDREFFEKIEVGTKAFALDPSRIYINLQGKYPCGSVKELDKESVVGELTNQLSSLKDEHGNSVIRKICESHDLYSGPVSYMGPDLVCLANDGYDLKGSLQKEQVFGKEHFTGMHTSYDAHCILPENVQKPSKLHIENLASIILDHFC